MDENDNDNIVLQEGDVEFLMETNKDQMVKLENGDTRVTWRIGKMAFIADYRLNAFGQVECVATKKIVDQET